MLRYCMKYIISLSIDNKILKKKRAYIIFFNQTLNINYFN